MRNAISRGGLLVGAIAAAGLGLWLLGPSAAPDSRHNASTTSGRPTVRAEESPLARATPNPTDRAPATRPATAPATPDSRADTMARARDLIRRIKDIGQDFNVPDDLRADLMAFMTESEESRDLLFRMAWNPANPVRVSGNLGLFLRLLEDKTLGAELLAAFNRFDPENAVREEVAAKSKDRALFVAELRALAPGKARFDRLAHLEDRDACLDPDVSAFLKETAESDPDIETRVVAFNRLAWAGVEGTRDLLTGVLSDPGRTLRERQSAAHSMQLLTDRPTAEQLLRLYDEATDEVRPLIVTSFADAGPSARIDDLLLENAVALSLPRNLRTCSTVALGHRLVRLKGNDARNLGDRTAAIVRSSGPETTAEMLKYLGLAVVDNVPLRDAVRDLSRTAPSGGVLQVAIASNPALKMAAGL